MGVGGGAAGGGGRGSARKRAAEELAAAARWVPLSELKRWERNPRKNDGENAAVEKLKVSIRAFGFISPVVVWTSRKRLVAGDTRCKALREILAEDPTFVPRHAPGPGLVPVREIEFASEAEADAYALADNRLGEIAEWDDAGVGAILRDIAKAGDVDVATIGWSQREMDALTAIGNERVPGLDDPGIAYEEKYAVLVKCRDEVHQKEVFAQLAGLGFEVKVLAL